MTVQPFDLAGCPRVSAREARATRRALSVVAGIPPHWTCELPPLGAAALAIVGVGGPRVSVGPSPVELALIAGVFTGRLLLGATFAARLVDAVLRGSGIRSLARAFGPAQRGLLVGLLGRTFEAAGWVPRLGAPPRISDGVAIGVHLELPRVGAGVVWAVLPDAVTGGGSAAVNHRHERAARLPVTVAVELAVTSLSAAATSALTAGDAVVFDGMATPRVGDACEVRLAIGRGDDRYIAPARLSADGVATLEGGFERATSAIMEERNMETTNETPLVAAPIEVVAEIGRVNLRGGEAMALTPGAVLVVGVGRRSVLLRVGGEPWAEGEMVDVEGELGVRVTRLLVR
jgi:flagellar motor switch/type III secretory pathway protein FliN